MSQEQIINSANVPIILRIVMIWLLLNLCGGMELWLNDFELFTIFEVIHSKVSRWVIEPHFFKRGCDVQSCYAVVNVLRLSWWKSSQCKGWDQKQATLIWLFFLPTCHRLETSGKGELQLRQCSQQTGLKTRDCRAVFLIDNWCGNTHPTMSKVMLGQVYKERGGTWAWEQASK